MSPGWWVALAVAAALAVVCVLAPLRVEVSAQGRGEPSGAWALAGGVEVGPLAMTALGAQGVEASVQVFAFGRQLWKRPLGVLFARERDPEKSGPPLAERWRSFERWLDPVETLGFVLSERRRVRVVRLEADLRYSFADIALTGKLLGALYALGALLPPQVVLRQAPSWESLDRGSLALSGRIKVWPGLLFLDTLSWLARHLRFRRRPAVTDGATP